MTFNIILVLGVQHNVLDIYIIYDLPNKSSTYLAPYTVVTILPPIFPKLHSGYLFVLLEIVDTNKFYVSNIYQ